MRTARAAVPASGGAAPTGPVGSTGGNPPCGRSRPRIGRGGWSLVILVVGLATTAGGWVATATRARFLWGQAERSAKERRWDQVEAALAAYSWCRPSDPAALRLRAHAAYQGGKTEEALRYLMAVPKSSPIYPAAQIQRASILMDRLRLRESETVLLACLRYDVATDEAQRRLLGIYGVQRRNGDYNALLWRAYRPGLRGLVTLILLAASTPAISAKSLVPIAASEEEALRQWIAADPDDFYVRPLLARVLRDASRYDEMRRLLEPWLREHPDDVRAASEWVGMLLDRGDSGAATAWLDPIPDPARRSPSFWLLRGRWLEEAGRVDEAEASYRVAIRLEPADIEAHLRLRQSLHRRGQGAEADRIVADVRHLGDLKVLADRIAEHPDRPEMWARAGRLCSQLGRLREARGWFAQVLRVVLDDAEARDFLRLNPG